MEGVGPASQRIIEEYIKTGRSTDYEELSESVPAGLIPLLGIPSLGPKTIGLRRFRRHVREIKNWQCWGGRGRPRLWCPAKFWQWATLPPLTSRLPCPPLPRVRRIA